MNAQQQDRLLRFAAVVRPELEASGETVALVARSGLNLSRFGLRYSHAGVSLQGSGNAPWSVRQLYFACDERRPRLYDQGLAGFLFGTDDPTVGYISIVLLPGSEAAALERAALDRPRALRLLAANYSANAYPFSLRYQNCNQWVVELLATAWGALDERRDLRARAQAWLSEQGYEPPTVDVDWLMLAAPFIPWSTSTTIPRTTSTRCACAPACRRPSRPSCASGCRVPGASSCAMSAPGRHPPRLGALAEGCLPEAGDRVVDL